MGSFVRKLLVFAVVAAAAIAFLLRREVAGARERVTETLGVGGGQEEDHALSPTRRYTAVIRVSRGGHNSVRMFLSIRNTCRPELSVALPVRASSDSFVHLWPLPLSDAVILWSENENALVVRQPNGTAFVVDFSQVIESVGLVLNWNDDVLRKVDLESKVDTWNARNYYFSRGGDSAVNATVLTNLPAVGVVGVVADALGRSPDIYGRFSVAENADIGSVKQAEGLLVSTNRWEQYAACNYLWPRSKGVAVSVETARDDPVLRWWRAAYVAKHSDGASSGDDASDTVSEFAEALTVPDGALQGMTWWALSKLRPDVKARSVEEWQVYRSDRSNAVEFLTGSLSRGRVAAVTPLGEIGGEKSIPPLLNSITRHNGVDWEHKHQKAISKLAGYPDVFWLSNRTSGDTLRSFWTMCNSTPTADMTVALKDEQPWLRQAALLALGRRHGTDAESAIVQHGRDKHQRVEAARQAALAYRRGARALDPEAEAPNYDQVPAELLRLYVETTNPAYIEKLKSLGETGLPYIIEAFGQWGSNRFGDAPFFDYVVAQGDSSVPIVLKGLSSSNHVIRAWSVRALERLGRPETVPMLCDVALRVPNEQATDYARSALKGDSVVHDALPIILTATEDESSARRAAAYSTLYDGIRHSRSLRPDDDKAIEEAVFRGVSDTDAAVQQVSLRLGRSLLRQGKLSDERFASSLVKLVGSDSGSVVLGAVANLKELGRPLGEDGLRALSRVARTETNALVRSNTIEFLCEQTGPEARKSVVQLASDANPKVRGLVARWVPAQWDATAKELLVNLSHDDDPTVRRYAAIACRCFPLDAGTKRRLKKSFAADRDFQVRGEADGIVIK